MSFFLSIEWAEISDSDVIMIPLFSSASRTKSCTAFVFAWGLTKTKAELFKGGGPSFVDWLPPQRSVGEKIL